MSEPLLTFADVQAISGETYTEPELTQVNRFITLASAKLRNRVNGLDDRITAGTLDLDLVKGVGAEIVIRALATIRRGGVRRTEYPEWSTEYEPASDSGQLVYVTADDIADLIDTAGSGDSFTIRIDA